MRRFWEKVDKTENFWNWTAGTRNGYGSFKYEGKVYDSHRFVWFLTTGSFPINLMLHKCNNKICVNPDHLYDGAYKDNVRDSILAGTHRFAISRKKLSEQEVLEIRKLYELGKVGYKTLGKKYHIHPETVRQIIKRQTWK